LFSALYWIATCIENWVRSLLGRPPRAWLTILYYHSLPADFRFEFQRQMEALSRSANVVAADFRGVAPTRRRNVAITFDDAFSSIAENAIPVLASHSFPCAIFVPVGLMGRLPCWEVEDPGSTFRESVMTQEQLSAISSSSVTFGSHTMNHPHLPQLSEASIKTEVEDSRGELQRLTGLQTRLIAFPYGESDRRVLQICQEAGYDICYTTVPENIDPSAPTMTRGRIRVDPWDGPIEFFLKFNGAYDWTSRIPGFLKSNRIRTHRDQASLT
jgi:peptidoglycan/xylan/chitin deacetylase (PgdA/CDA1 family)